MSVPTKRRTSSQHKRRASHFALKKAVFSECAKCSARVLAHRICPECGEYKKQAKSGESKKA
ncbi:50S ribosomal protein L32 [bacterium]|nr:50S ribosomal protein L32 [bacterium]MDP6571551.1 50S ribosomal protein L32 [Patescibacteria group bacterium]MDP6756465.1 50S ribosomal protein L32 [Patescibacteria group bacterium]|tara:strand:+ start:404 stop:589 length:186 start_codon:yes stop_codon:yes gene_type:complete